MLDEKFLQSLSIEQIDKEIKLRKDLINEMVGWLYPTILRDEICQLVLQRNKL